MIKRLGITFAIFAATVIGPVAITSAGASVGASDPTESGWLIVNNGSYSSQSSLPSDCLAANNADLYSSIQSAVDAADASVANSSATSTPVIYVCAGTYDESITIDEPIILYGAQYDTDAVTRYASSTASPETVIDGAGGVTYVTGATTGTLEGFTLNSSTTYYEISAANVGSAWQFENNIIDASNGGIYLNTNGIASPDSTAIEGNEFIQSTPHSDSGDGYYGSAVALWGGTSNNVTISNNDMLNLTGPDADINTTGTGMCDGNGVGSSTGLDVSDNTFEENGSVTNSGNNFLALFCTTGAQVTGNTLTVTDLFDGNAESPIFLGGGDISPVVSGNTITGNLAYNADGVKFNTGFYPVDNPTITDNTISGFDYGIYGFGGYGSHLPAPTGFSITDNIVTGNFSGIALWNSDGVPSGGLISGNTINGSLIYGCVDLSSGTLTASTANTWTNNAVSNAVGAAGNVPAGICGTSNVITPSMAPSNAMVGGTSYGVSASASSGDVVTISLNTSSSGCSLNSSTDVVTFTGIGTCVIDFSDPGNGTYGPASTSQSFSVGQAAAQVVTFTGPLTVSGSAPTYSDAVTYPGVPYTVSASSNGDGPISYSALGCSVDPSTGVVTDFTGGTDCVITAKAAETVNYASGSSTLTISVGQAAAQVVTFTGPLTVSGSAPTYSDAVTYPGVPYTVSASSNGDGPISYSALGCSVDPSTGVVTDFTGGTDCVITAKAAETVNYASGSSTLTISVGQAAAQVVTFTGPLTVSGSAPTYSDAVTYPGVPYTVSASSNGDGPISYSALGCSVDPSTGVVTDFTGGTDCVITAKAAETVNYASGSSTLTISVGQAAAQVVTFTGPLTVSGSAPTYSDAVTYPGVPYTVSASSNGDGPISYSALGCSVDPSTGVVTDFTGGTDCVITAKAAETVNYASGSSTLTISVGQAAAQVVTFTGPLTVSGSAPTYSDAVTYPGVPYTVSASSNGDGPISYSALGCSVDPSTGVVTDFTGGTDCVITAKAAETVNYASGSSTLTISVGQAAAQVVTFTGPLTVSGSAPTYSDAVTYPGVPYTVSASSNGDGPISYSALGCSVDPSTGVVTDFTGGTDCVITAKAAETVNYASGSSTLTISVGQAAAQVVTFTGPLTVSGSAPTYSDAVTYPGVPYTVSASSNGDGPISYSALGCSVDPSTGVVTDFTGGTDCVITAKAAETVNYASGSSTLTISVGQAAAQVVTFTGPLTVSGSAPTYSDAVTYPGVPYTVSASSNGDGPISYSALGCSVDPSTGVVTDFTGGTDCVITAKAAETVNYASGSSTLTISVGQAAAQVVTFTGPLTVSGSAPTYSDAVTYPGVPYTVSASSNGDGPISYSALGCSVDPSTGVVTDFTGGTDCVITAKAAETVNYASGSSTLTISVGQAANAIDPSAPPSNAVVGGASYMPTASATSGNTTSSATPIVVSLGGSSTGCELISGVVFFIGVGTCVVDFADPGNVNFLPVTAIQDFNVASGTTGGGGSGGGGGAAPSSTATNDIISFNSEGGTAEETIDAANGTSVILPTPTRTGSTFLGWFTSNNGGTQVTSPLVVEAASTILYAHWQSTSTTPASVTFHEVFALHTFAPGSAVLTSAIKSQIKNLVTIFKARSYSAVLLQGNATVPNSASNKNLAKARALAVEAYMKKLGVKVTFSIEATVSGSTAKYSVVFVQAK